MRTEEIVSYSCGQGYKIKGCLCKAAPGKVALIAHPHPLYGGDMNNNVVTEAAHAFMDQDFSTLRFDFRLPQPESEPFAIPESAIEDLLCSCDFLESQGMRKITALGYSYGACAVAHAAFLEKRIHDSILVAPPVTLMEFPAGEIPGLSLVICAENDQFAPPGAVEQKIIAKNKNTALEVIEGADHFFFSKPGAIRAVLLTYLNRPT